MIMHKNSTMIPSLVLILSFCSSLILRDFLPDPLDFAAVHQPHENINYIGIKLCAPALQQFFSCQLIVR